MLELVTGTASRLQEWRREPEHSLRPEGPDQPKGVPGALGARVMPSAGHRSLRVWNSSSIS